MSKLIRRYQSNYGISLDSAITEEMILRHWNLEKILRKELLESDANERCDVFAACYSRLYSELDWLNRVTDSQTQELPALRYATWLSVIGKPPQKVYEIGSGKGQLIYYLAQCGFECKATEITRERGARWIPGATPTVCIPSASSRPIITMWSSPTRSLNTSIPMIWRAISGESPQFSNQAAGIFYRHPMSALGRPMFRAFFGSTNPLECT
jgi:hypothetical protein